MSNTKFTDATLPDAGPKNAPENGPEAEPGYDPIPSDSRHARQIARRQLIAETVMSEGSMRIEDLTSRFGISLMTAHRDLDELASRGLLRKMRGVVSAAPTSLIEASDTFRTARQGAEKRAIAAMACAEIEPGQAAFFDDSTTVFEMVPHLNARVPLTAITNSLTLMHALRATPDITLLGLGGQLHNWCSAFLGPVTSAGIRGLRADLAFLSTAAITDGQAFHQSQDMVGIKRAMLECADRRILLADHSKFSRRALHAMASLREFDLVIVDSGLDPALAERMLNEGVRLKLAPVAGDDTAT
ncbi:DeoR/GlpR transcriptional regulator [Xinfangfangia sp. D13-10-4-6]|uniref:DeoR/GlpR family DNA-binding transcription regulator n=1 Tax=Pseudogemmobacter hezensis TaxID=2737662 RepID=UPI00155298C8|nr:DeoR/GlpR family DNA-binding transcription regulator [Pseudogemmobacter hezensis]NPD16531.1 DeoR/GlpR transcriptional regulator [Pseudogemmobacter hezensis]